MEITPSAIEGVMLLTPDGGTDERGSSLKLYSKDVYSTLGLEDDWGQTLLVSNLRRGTLRGMHWQALPHGETKLVHCTRGRVFDVVVDIRIDSPTRGRWVGYELDADHPTILYIAPGLAHGYLTLEDDSQLLYQIAGNYLPDAQCVLRWDDTEIGIAWPESPKQISHRDATAPRWDEI